MRPQLPLHILQAGDDVTDVAGGKGNRAMAGSLAFMAERLDCDGVAG